MIDTSRLLTPKAFPQTYKVLHRPRSTTRAYATEMASHALDTTNPNTLRLPWARYLKGLWQKQYYAVPVFFPIDQNRCAILTHFTDGTCLVGEIPVAQPTSDDMRVYLGSKTPAPFSITFAPFIFAMNKDRRPMLETNRGFLGRCTYYNKSVNQDDLYEDILQALDSIPNVGPVVSYAQSQIHQEAPILPWVLSHPQDTFPMERLLAGAIHHLNIPVWNVLLMGRMLHDNGTLTALNIQATTPGSYHQNIEVSAALADLVLPAAARLPLAHQVSSYPPSPYFKTPARQPGCLTRYKPNLWDSAHKRLESIAALQL